jgi:ABC-type transport system involved in multi-copper enzyme maturation permease subunit
MRSLFALTRLTVSDFARQPVTWLMTAVSLALLGLSYLFGHFNFETNDRLRMLSTAGVAVGVINGLFLAVIGASQSVHDELTSRTALTLFAKPLSRGSFLVGKALGIWLVLAGSGIIIAAAHMGILAYALHTGFESDPTRRGWLGFDDLQVPWTTILAAHGLGLVHGLVFSCLATVLALRLPLIANILGCFAIFVIANLLAGSGFLGMFVIPALTLYNLDDSIQLPDRPLSVAYVSLTMLYSTLYCGGCLLIGLALFKRQDIA